MQIIQSESDIRNIKKGCVLTIGNFDGVHIGHQRIIQEAKSAVGKEHAELVAMTFCPHPVAILFPDKNAGVLTPIELKKHLLKQCGVDLLLVLKGTRELLALSAGEFMERFLIRAIRPRLVVEGHDFHFGSGRDGSVDRLRQLATERGFEVLVIDPVTITLGAGREDVRVSSTMIRELLQGGDVAGAAAAMGRAYRLLGQVVQGRGKGRQLGFPTANLESVGQIIPAEGVYAGFVELGDDLEAVCGTNRQIPAALSIGQAATYGSGQRQLIEAHLLRDQVGALVGKWMGMDFVERLRGQQKFESEKSLSIQIAEDCVKARAILAG